MDLFSLLQENQRAMERRAADAGLRPTVSPDALGEAVEKAPVTGVAPDQVLADPTPYLKLFEQQAAAARLRGSPNTAGWMDEDPVNARMIYDELPTVVDLEKFATSYIREQSGGSAEVLAKSFLLKMQALSPNIQLAFNQGGVEFDGNKLDERSQTLQMIDQSLKQGEEVDFDALPQGDRAYYERYALFTPEARAAERERLVAQYAADTKNQEHLRSVIKGYQDQLGYLYAGRTLNLTDIRDLGGLYDYATVGVGGAVVDVIGALVAAAGGGLVGSLAGPEGTVAGAAIGGFAYGSAMTFNDINSQLAAADAPYTTTDVRRALLMSAASGAVEAALGPAARGVTRVAAKALVKEAYSEVTQEVLERTAQGYLRRIGREYVANGVEEFFQEGAQYFLEKYGVEGENFKFTDDTLLEAFNASMTGFFGGGLAGGALNTRSAIALERASKELTEAGRTVANMQQLATIAKDLKLADRSPTKFQELATRLGLGNVPVFYQAEALDAHWRAQGLNPEAEIVKLGGNLKDYQAALTSGGRVAVTAEGLIRTGLRGESATFLQENGSFTPAGYSPKDMKNYTAVLNEVKQDIADQTSLEAMKPERRQVYETIYSQLRNAGRGEREAEADATMATAFFETMAARYGAPSGLDMFQRFGLEIKGQAQLDREAAGQAAQAAAVPDDVVQALDTAVNTIEAGQPLQLDLTAIPAEAVQLLRDLGVEIAEDGTIPAEQVQQVRDAVIGMAEDVAKAADGTTLDQRLVDTKNREARLLRSVDELEQYALGQMDWKDWYDRYQALLDDLFGQDADLIRKILAATSQAASVPANVGLALKAYEQMLSGQPFTGYLPAVIKNLERIREDIALSGQKIGQYGAAVTGDDDGIAIDRHVAMIMFDTKSPTAQQVELGKQTVREIATRLGWKPREVQAALWAANIARSGKEPQSYDTYLIKKADQIRTLRAAFSSPILGGSSAGDGAGGAVDQGTEDGGQTLFQSQLKRGTDTSVAGGLTEKSYITVRELEGAMLTPIFADLTSAGNVYDQLDGLPVAPTTYMGGPNFPWLKAFRDANVVWAFNDKAKITMLRNKVRELSRMGKEQGGDGRVVITVLAMKDDAHTSNEMAISALLNTLDAVVAAGKFPEGQLEIAKEMIVSKAKKKDEGYAGLASFVGFGDAAALAEWSRKASFTTRKALATEMQSAAFQNLEGMFPVSRIIREALDPDYRATQQGDMLLAFEIDPDDPNLIIDFQKFRTKKDKQPYGRYKDKDGTTHRVPRHPAYQFGLKGKLLGSFNTHLPMEIMYGGLLKATYDRIGENLDREQADAQKKAEKAGQPFTPLTAEEREAAIKSKQGNWTPKFALERGRTTDGQLVTRDIVEEAEVLEGLHDYRVAHALLAGAAGRWRSSDNKANKGGIQPVEFERALVENDAAVTLTKYSRTDVQEGQKDGSLRVFQLGDTRVQDGGLNVWMAVKKNVDYREEYGGPVTEKLVADGVLSPNETVLVGVANNELGVKGMATFQVLKGIEEGVTVLDAFKVRSASKPYGLLPTIYATLGFEEVGEIPFDPQYFTPAQLADLKAVWARQGWVEADGYPTVAIMKWRGDDAARSEATRRFVEAGLEGLGFGANERIDALEAAQSRVSDSVGLGDQGGGVTGQGDGRANPWRFGDRARGLSAQTRDFVRNLIKADPRATKALKLDDALITKLKELYAPELAASMVEDVEMAQQQGTTYNQNQPSGVRGSITFPTAGVDGNKSIIKLFGEADRSTFTHEMGHFFLEAFKVLANDPRAPQAMRDDWATINEWLGRDPADTSPFTVEQHEKWARGFEAYVMEGNAPSVGLRSAFSRFKNWLTSIYRDVLSLQVELSPEVREVMDRMLATDEQIALAKAEQQIGDLFAIKPDGMSQADYDAYRKAAVAADDIAHERLLTRLMRQIKVQRSREYRDAKAQLQTEAEKEVSELPVYRLVDKLLSGDIRLNKKQIEEMFGKEALKEVSRTKLGGKTAIYADDGADLGVVAELAGYADPTEMMVDLMDAKKRSTEVELRVQDKLLQRFGADYTGPETLREAAVAELHNEGRASMLSREAKEIERQAKAQGVTLRPTSIDRLRAQARDMIADSSMRQAANANSYLMAERKAGMMAQRAFAAIIRIANAEGRPVKDPNATGKDAQVKDAKTLLRDAHRAKQQQLLNHFMYIEARKVEASVAKARKMVAKLEKAATRKQIASPYIDRIMDLLHQYDLRPTTQKQLAARNALADFVKEMEAAGREGELAIPQRVIDRARRTHYSTLTVEEFYEIIDTVQNLEHLGRTKMQLLDAKKNRDFAKVKGEVMGALDANLTDQSPDLIEAAGGRRKFAAQTALNSILTADTILNKLDGSVGTVGAVWRAIKERISLGQAAVQVRQQKAKQDIAKLFSDHYSSKELDQLRSKDIPVTSIRRTMPKSAILAVALNTGNRDNMVRMTDPNNPYSFKKSDIDAMLKEHMTEKDWRFVQAVWDYIGSYWPEIAAQEKALTGVTPKGVTAKTQVAAPAFVTGGYYPIRYDPRLSARVSDIDHNEALKNLRAGRTSKAQTPNGHTKAREQSTGLPLRLELDIIPSHIDEVIYDLEMRQPVQNAWRILNDKEIVEKFNAKGVTAELNALRLWVQDVANGDRWSGGGFDAALAYLRGGLSVAKMAFSITTLVQQPTGLLQSAVVVGKGAMAKALWKYKNNPVRHSAAVVTMSNFMAERQGTFQRDLMALQQAVATDPTMGKLSRGKQWFIKAGFYLIQKSQFYIVDVPTWMAAYDKELRRNGGDSKAAASVADQIVARAQGSGLLTDRTAIERGTISQNQRGSELAKVLTAFGSYMMAKFNVAVQQGRATDFKSPTQVASFMLDILFLYTFEAAIGAFLTGNWPEIEDEEDYWQSLGLWAAGKTVTGIMSGIPLVREAGSVIDGFGGGGGQASIVEGLTKGGQGAFDLAMILTGLEDDDKARTALKDMITGIGIGLQLPASQVNRGLTAIFEKDMSLRGDFQMLDMLLGRKD